MTELEILQRLQLDAHVSYAKSEAWRNDPGATAYLHRVFDPFEAGQLDAVGPAHLAELKEINDAALRAHRQARGTAAIWRIIRRAKNPGVKLCVIHRFWHPMGHMPPGMLEELPRLFAAVGMEAGRAIFNNASEMAAWNQLPAEVRVFRGALAGPGEAGLSWSPHFDMALRFAVWRSRQTREAGMNLRPVVIAGMVAKVDVFGMHTEGTKDPEVIADPAKVQVEERLDVEAILAGQHNRKVIRWMFGIDLDSGDPAAVMQLLQKAAELRAEFERAAV
jgi:hypothetical protein